MIGIKIKKQLAQQVKQYLLTHEVFDFDHLLKSDEHYVYFPVAQHISNAEVDDLVALGAELVDINFDEKQRNYKSITEYLSDKLSAKELGALVTSFDIIGHVAIIEIPEILEPKEQLIGEAILAVHKNVRTVCKKVGGHKGVFRIQELKVIAGEPNTETMYIEHGCKMQLDVAKVYFSPRLSNERVRIARLVKPNEIIGALFAGVGPFPLVICKVQPKVRQIFAVELNPDACYYLKQNIKLNHFESSITPICGDVREVAPNELRGVCDRVLMTAPKQAEDFILEGMTALKESGGYIHVYAFAPEDNLYGDILARLHRAATSLGRSLRIVGKRVVRAHRPHIDQVCVDAFVSAGHPT